MLEWRHWRQCWWVKVVFAYLVLGAAAEAYCVRTKYGCCWDGSVAKVHVGTAADRCPGKCSSVKKPTNVQHYDIANYYILLWIFLNYWVFTSSLLFYFTFIQKSRKNGELIWKIINNNSNNNIYFSIYLIHYLNSITHSYKTNLYQASIKSP